MLIGGLTIVEGVVPGSCSMAWPRSDVRRWCSRRGSKHQAKARGRLFHPGATGERQTGRVKHLNLWLMSRYGHLRWWDAGAESRDWPLGSGRRRLRNALSREEHRRPRDTGGTHPGRSSCMRNAVTPVEVRCCSAGKPTVRKAQPLGGNLMTEKRMPAAERQRETGTSMAGPLRLVVPHNRLDTGSGARARKGADAVR
jgi:hypothetical protein